MGEADRLKNLAVVPALEWHDLLLGDGLCGARAPCVVFHAGAWKADLRTFDTLSLPRAMPLIWQGECVPEGADRAWRALGQYDGGFLLAFEESIDVYPPLSHSELLWRLAEILVSQGIASVTIFLR